MDRNFHRGPVAQLDRASDFGSEGWGFDSLRGRQNLKAFRLLSGQTPQRLRLLSDHPDVVVKTSIPQTEDASHIQDSPI
jgi:hypothetical protein